MIYHLLFEGRAVDTQLCLGYQEMCYGFFAPDFQTLKAFSVSQWKSDYCPTLSSSPVTDISQSMLDPLAMGHVKSTVGPSLEDGDLGWNGGIVGCDRTCF